MRPGHADQIGAAREQDCVRLIGFGDVADRDGRDTHLVADAVGGAEVARALGPDAVRQQLVHLGPIVHSVILENLMLLSDDELQ